MDVMTVTVSFTEDDYWSKVEAKAEDVYEEFEKIQDNDPSSYDDIEMMIQKALAKTDLRATENITEQIYYGIYGTSNPPEWKNELYESPDSKHAMAEIGQCIFEADIRHKVWVKVKGPAGSIHSINKTDDEKTD